jgi:hypothetical protein
MRRNPDGTCGPPDHSRFELTSEQATRWFVTEERTRAGITLSDKDIIANPYRCYEADRDQEDPITLA